MNYIFHDKLVCNIYFNWNNILSTLMKLRGLPNFAVCYVRYNLLQTVTCADSPIKLETVIVGLM